MELLPELREMFDLRDPMGLGPERRSSALPQGAVEEKVQEIGRKHSISGEALQLIRSAMLLWHDHLDESHSVSQNIHTPDGSLLHAVMHRREPDYWNSKYWWKRVGEHSCFQILAVEAERVLTGKEALKQKLVHEGRWDASAFVDAVERAIQNGEEKETVVRLQAMEMESFLRSL